MANGLKTEAPQIKTEEICENISDNIISITESKAKLVYRKYMGGTMKGAIFSNLGLAIAFATPVLTSSFKNIWWIPSDAIIAVFILMAAIFFYKSARALIYFAKYGRFLDEEHFIKELKGQEEDVIKIKKSKKQVENIRKQAFIEGYLAGKRRR